MDKNIVKELGEIVFDALTAFVKQDDYSYECSKDGITVCVVYDPGDSESDSVEDFDEDDEIKSSAIWRILVFSKETKEIMSTGTEIANDILKAKDVQAIYSLIEDALNDANDDGRIDVKSFMHYIKGIDNPLLNRYMERQ